MEEHGRIVTVGLSPAWDIRCRGQHLDWGRHAEIDEQVIRPAGKALNVSYALAWMGIESLAAGLWGRDDHDQMQAAVAKLGGLIQAQMTPADGRTRQNLTIVDTVKHREMHLRHQSRLASRRSLSQLNADLGRLLRTGDTCVFAGAMPGGALSEQILDLVRTCHHYRARVAVDTYGPVLKSLVDAGLPWLIAPNVEELRELLAVQVGDNPQELAAASRALLGKVNMILISRGEKGALLVARDCGWAAWSDTRHEVLSTVGCGDYLLAGFLAGLAEQDDLRAALTKGLKAATARAWAWSETKAWPEADREITIDVKSL